MEGDKRTSCPACCSTNLKMTITYPEWVQYHQESQKHFITTMIKEEALRFDEILQCQECSTIFTDKIPSPEALKYFYKTYYENESYFKKKDKKLALEKRKFFLLKHIMKGKNFLDIGCNIGCSVEAARLNGLKAYGVDYSDEAIFYAKQLFPLNQFYVGSCEQFKEKQALKFNAIQCAEVIEHCADPHQFIQEIDELLAPQGILILTTPEVQIKKTKKALLEWNELRPPEHITLLTKKGMNRLLKQYFKRVIFIPKLKSGIQLITFK